MYFNQRFVTTLINIIDVFMQLPTSPNFSLQLEMNHCTPCKFLNLMILNDGCYNWSFNYAFNKEIRSPGKEGFLLHIISFHITSFLHITSFHFISFHFPSSSCLLCCCWYPSVIIGIINKNKW